MRGNESVPRQKKGEPTKKLRKGKSTKKSGERKSKKRDGRKSASTGLTALPLKDEQARAVIGGTVPAAITTTTVAAGATVTEETSGSVMSPEEDHHSYEVSVNSVVTVKDCDHALQNFVYTQIWPIAKYGVDKDMLVDGGIAKRVMAFLGYHGEITPTYIGLWEVEKKKVLLHLRTKRFSNKAAIQQKAIGTYHNIYWMWLFMLVIESNTPSTILCRTVQETENATKGSLFGVFRQRRGINSFVRSLRAFGGGG